MTPTVLVPPLNFALVGPGVYRSGYPNRKNFEFLKKLQLKSILYILTLDLVAQSYNVRYLCEDDYSQDNLDFFKENGIQVFHVKMEGSKEPFKELSSDLMTEALLQALGTFNFHKLSRVSPPK